MTEMVGIDIERKGMYYRLIHRLFFFQPKLQEQDHSTNIVTLPSHHTFDTK